MWNLTLTVMLELGIQVDEAIVLLELVPDYIYIYIYLYYGRGHPCLPPSCRQGKRCKALVPKGWLGQKEEIRGTEVL